MTRVQVSHSLAPLHAELRQVVRQAPRAYRSALVDTAQKAAGHLNAATHAHGLGSPVEVWAHRGRLQVGVKAEHPRAGELWTHEYGSATQPPAAVFRRTALRAQPHLVRHFTDNLHSNLFEGTRWAR